MHDLRRQSDLISSGTLRETFLDILMPVTRLLHQVSKAVSIRALPVTQWAELLSSKTVTIVTKTEEEHSHGYHSGLNAVSNFNDWYISLERAIQDISHLVQLNFLIRDHAIDLV